VADERDVGAAAAHAPREAVHQVGAEGAVVERLDVDVGVPLVTRLVGDDHDSRSAGTRQHGFQGRGVVRDDRDRVGPPCNQTPDDRRLLARASVTGGRHPGVDAGPCGEPADPGPHALEPGQPSHLDHRDDARLGALGGRTRRAAHARADRRGDSDHQGQKGDGLE
jgi:hypothetical protein